MGKGVIISIVLSTLFTAAVEGQTPEFRHLTINDGLSQNAIYSIAQDDKGFMWFGTKDGLNRYDGQTFEVYRHEPSDSTTLSDSNVLALYTDHRGWLWVGTQQGGLNYYRPEKNTFSDLRNLSDDTNQIIDDRIYVVTEDLEGNIWVGTRMNGVYLVKRNPKTGIPESVTNFRHQKDQPESLFNNQIFDIFADETGTVWIGTDRAVSKYLPDTQSFHNFEISFEYHLNTDYQFYYSISSIHTAPNGKLWLGTSEGLMLFDRSSGETKLMPQTNDEDEPMYNRIRKMVEDSRGNLWLATPMGLGIYNPVTSEYQYLKSDPYDESSISYDSISSLFKSRNNILWVGTAGMGIDIYDPNSNRFPTLIGTELIPDLSSFSIREVMEDQNGDLWIVANRLFRWNREDHTLLDMNDLFIPKNFNDQTMEIWEFIQDDNGIFWAAGTQGLASYNVKADQLTFFEYNSQDPDGLPQREVYHVFEDRSGEIWIMTENFISHLEDRKQGKFRDYRFNAAESVREQIHPHIIENQAGNFWLGTSIGLLYFDKISESFTQFSHDPADTSSLKHNLIKSILPDPKYPDEKLWIGSPGGLSQFDLQTKKFTHYTTADGLPNNVIYGILPDNFGKLWVSTNRGLSTFHPEEMDFRNYDVRDGLQSNEFNTGAFYKSDSGELFFGGISGLNYFYPERITNNPNVPEIALTGFRIGEREVTYQNSPEILDAPLSSVKNIRVNHNDEVLTFDFAALDYSAPEKNQYAYKLEGLNNSWVETGNYGSAIFTNIPHGEYTLRIKASNNDGVWNEAGIGIGLVVTPPWWQTWWAYLLYMILFVSGGYSLRRYELNRYHLKNQLDLERVQTESLRKLDRLKSQFFANISHEFRTPLTLILGQIENVLTSDIQYKDKRKLQEATHNANRLLILINQLLDLSKLEAGKMKMNNEQHNIVSFLKSLLNSFETLAETKEITLSFKSETNWIPVIFDSEKLERVFLNLLTNAFKFTESGGKIGITVKKISDTNVEIRVKDTGIGIPANRLNNIFDRFYQVDSSTTRPHEGTGIGLALVNEFVKLHDGYIEVQSHHSDENAEELTGTEFIIQLPIGHVDHSQKDEKEKFQVSHFSADKERTASASHKAELNFLPANLHNEILLIVEDNAEVREFIREQLEDDYRVLEAANGIEGIEISREEIPDLIISDLMMPGMDGYGFCKQIRDDEKTSHIPVIMLTAKAGLDSKLKGLETGIDAYLTKPFKVKELKVWVRKLIQRRKELRKQFSDSGLIQTTTITDDSIEKTFLEKAIGIVENNFNNEQFKVRHLATELNMSPSQLNRKLQALLDHSAVQFIIAIRLQHAAKLLQQKNKTIAEISYEVGYNDQAYFTRVFKKQFGMSPSEFRKN